MLIRFCVSLSFILIVSGCAKPAQDLDSGQDRGIKPSQVEAKKVQSPPPVSLSRMDNQFLYLAAQKALHDGQPTLAVRFLSTLVKKEPNEVLPRFELVDLLLAGGKKKEAMGYIEAMSQPAVDALADEELLQYQQLYARSLIANGQTEQATTLLEDVLIKQPDNIDVRLLLARVYAIHGKYILAHETLTNGLKRKKDVRLQNMQVQLYLQQGRFSDADKTLARMQSDYPEQEDIVLQRAHLAEKQGAGVKAEMLLKAFIDTHEKTAVQSYHMLAGIYVRQNRLTPAIATYKTMLPLTGDDSEVLMSLGKLYYQMQAFAEARDYFKRAVTQLTPQKQGLEVSEALATASFYYGASLEASHEWKQAVPEYERLLPKHNLFLDAQLRLASIDITLKILPAAEKRLLALKKTYENELDVYEMLSGLRLQQKRYHDAISESDSATDLGYSKVLLFNRAVAFEKLKKFEQLDEALSVILGKEPNDAETLNFYGYSLADRGVRLDAAREMIEKALVLKPNDGFYLDSLAWVLYKQKNYVLALESQLKAIEIIHNDAVMMEHLGDIYWRTGDVEQARSSWEKALEAKHDEPKKIKAKIKSGLM